MHDRNLTFRPRYQSKLKTAFSGCLVFALLGLLIAFVDPQERWMGIACFAFFGLLSTGWMLLPRAIVFDDAIIVQRALLPDQRIEYEDVEIGMGRLKGRWGGFSWIQMKNGDELAGLIYQLVEEGTIPEGALDGEAVTSDLAGLHAWMITAVALPLVALLIWFGVVPSTWFVGVPPWLFKIGLPLGLMLGAYGVMRYVLRRRPAEDQMPEYERPSISWGKSRRFTPSVARIAQRSIWAALLLLVGVPAGLAVEVYEPGEVGVPFLALIGFAAALLFILYEIGREWWRGLTRVEIDRDSIRTSCRRGDRELLWDDVAHYECVTKGREGIRLASNRDEQPLWVSFAGFSFEERAELHWLILDRLEERGLLEADVPGAQST